MDANFVHELFRQPALLGGQSGRFLVVAGYAQLLCHQLADALAR